jgi:hypothetical protein
MHTEMLSNALTAMAQPKTVAIPRETFDRFVAYCLRNSKIQRGALARILDGFLRQSELIQKAVSDEVTAGMEGRYADALEELAEIWRERAKGITVTGQEGALTSSVPQSEQAGSAAGGVAPQKRRRPRGSAGPQVQPKH